MRLCIQRCVDVMREQYPRQEERLAEFLTQLKQCNALVDAFGARSNIIVACVLGMQQDFTKAPSAFALHHPGIAAVLVHRHHPA